MLSKQTVKYIQSLQHKKFRDEFNEFVAEGPKIVKELLLNGKFECKSIYALSIWVQSLEQEILESFQNIIHVIEEHELQKMAHYATPNNVVSIFKKAIPATRIDVKKNITLILDGIQDPGNLGTIIRNADWFGVKNIICSRNTVDMYNSKVVQSTMASLARVNIIYTDLKEWLLNNHEVNIYATVLNGLDVSAGSLDKECIIMIGNEANGLSADIIAMADKKITIPSFGLAESLNAGVASALVLYECRR